MPYLALWRGQSRISLTLNPGYACRTILRLPWFALKTKRFRGNLTLDGLSDVSMTAAAPLHAIEKNRLEPFRHRPLLSAAPAAGEKNRPQRLRGTP
jgi:hypothetical protein